MADRYVAKNRSSPGRAPRAAGEEDPCIGGRRVFGIGLSAALQESAGWNNGEGCEGRSPHR